MLLAAALPAAVSAQTTGRLLGTIIDAATGAPIPGATVRLVHLPIGTVTREDGRYVLPGAPAGEHEVRVELIGYEARVFSEVRVFAGRPTLLNAALTPAAVAVEGVEVRAERVPLIEPEVALTHEIVVGEQLRTLPIDRVEDAIELAVGVTDGHFRGGRVGQEAYVVDGLELKNPLEASTQGFGLELSPSALEEVDIVTGGFGAAYGNALSGVVQYVTRRGDPERWEGQLGVRTDEWAPEPLFFGFSELNLSLGGPVAWAGEGATLFVDGLVQGMLDADPRARGLTCLRAEDAPEDLAARIRAMEASPTGAQLLCPYEDEALPGQAGDKLIGFARFDRPLARGTMLTVTLLRNRLQNGLYLPAFKYNTEHQLGQRTTGTVGQAIVDWSGSVRERSAHVTARLAGMRLDRFLGVLEPGTHEDALLGRFRPGGYAFVGEDFVRRPIEEQIADNRPIPGYVPPGGSVASPFGPAAEGIFFTEGTPDLANWTTSQFVSGDLEGELLSPAGHTLKAGTSAKLFEIESYERLLGHLAGSYPYYVRFYPRQVTGFAELRLAAADEVTVQLGARLDAFDPGLTFSAERANLDAPVTETEWQVSFMPRIGVSAPVPGSDGRTAVRFNYGQVAQPPDFRFFLDTSLGDSLRTDIRRQGNPNLAFERGASYEGGVTQLLGSWGSLGVTAFRKELTNLVTGSIRFAGYGSGQFTTGDFGTVQGVETRLRARLSAAEVRLGYALQKATGVSSSALEDSIDSGDRALVEYPLAFDRRHAVDAAVFLGSSAGLEAPWAATALFSAASGYPVDRLRVGGGAPGTTTDEYLPWTVKLDLRAAYELGALPGCGRCRWRVVADGQNVLGRENVLALRRETGLVGPTLEQVAAVAASGTQPTEPIPFESPDYARAIDFNGDGLITPSEYADARFAAALDRMDPSIFFAEPRQLRLGLEVAF